MTTSQYKNIIDNTVNMMSEEEKNNSVTVANKILNNSGRSLLDATPAEIKETLSGNDYLGWKECSATEAQELANNGVSTIGVSENRVVVIEPELEGSTLSANANVSTVSELSEEEISTMSFYSGRSIATSRPLIPTRIAQNSDDPQWNANLWGSYSADIAKYACSAACAAMAHDNLGSPVSLVDILDANVQAGQPAYSCIWTYGVPRAVSRDKSDLEGWIARYRNDSDKYAPPIVWVKTKQGSSHYIIVFNIDTESGTLYAIDPGYHGYDKTNQCIVTNYWKVSDINSNSKGNHIVQYYYS